LPPSSVEDKKKWSHTSTPHTPLWRAEPKLYLLFVTMTTKMISLCLLLFYGTVNKMLEQKFSKMQSPRTTQNFKTIQLATGACVNPRRNIALQPYFIDSQMITVTGLM
jgi:hypothetical protein